MKTFSHILPVVSLTAALATGQMAQAQTPPLIYDANGTFVATPAGVTVEGGHLAGYLRINGSVVVVGFYPSRDTSSKLEWSSQESGSLFYRSEDCSGPALIVGDPGTGALGTVPAALVPEHHHTWLHIAESTEGLGVVESNSVRSPHKACEKFQYSAAMWKALPAIDLDTMFTPPFSIH
jgi:hypothetical protein